MPIPVAALSKVWVYSRKLAGIVGSNPAGGVDVCFLWVLCVVRHVFTWGWSLVHRSPTACREDSVIRRHWPT